MELTIKIMLIIFSILILSVYNVFFPVIEIKKVKRVTTKKITYAGKWFIALVVFLIGLNIWALVYDQNKDNETSQQLKDIKSALKDKGLTFDSASNKIIGNNYTDNSSGDKIGFHGNNISDVKISDVKQEPDINEYYAVYKQRDEILQNIKLCRLKFGIKSKEIILFYTEGTKGYEATSSMRDILGKAGYTVYQSLPYHPKGNEFQKGMSFDSSKGKLLIIMGDLNDL